MAACCSARPCASTSFPTCRANLAGVNDGIDYALTHLAYSKAPPIRSHPSDAPLSLPRNPLPEPDLNAAEQRELILQGVMMGGRGMGMGGMMGMGRAVWAINGTSMTGDGHAGMPLLKTL